MTPVLRVWVPGVAKPGGSKRGYIRRSGGKVVGVGVADQAEGTDWRARCAWFAGQEWAPERGRRMDRFESPTLVVPLRVTFRFVRLRPASHFKTKAGRPSDVLKASAPAYPTTRPDGLKLARAAEDALSGVVWTDDSVIVRHVIDKDYGAEPGVEIIVELME